MPQDEFTLGFCPSNHHAYSPFAPTPTWDDLLTLLAREKITTLWILFCGVGGSPGRDNFGKAAKTFTSEVQHVALQGWDVTQPLKTFTGDPVNTIDYADALIGFRERPTHITGIVVRKLN